MTLIDRIKAANRKDIKSRKSMRSGQTTAQMPVLKRIANGTIPPKKTQEGRA